MLTGFLCWLVIAWAAAADALVGGILNLPSDVLSLSVCRSSMPLWQSRGRLSPSSLPALHLCSGMLT